MSIKYSQWIAQYKNIREVYEDHTHLRDLLRECRSDYATAWQVIQETLDNNAIRPEDKDRLIKLRNALYVLKHKLNAKLGEK